MKFGFFDNFETIDYVLIGLSALMILSGMVMGIVAYLRKRVPGPNYMYVEEDGWQEGNNERETFTKKRKYVFITGIILSIFGRICMIVIGFYSHFRATINYEYPGPRGICFGVMTEVDSAKTDLGHLPSYKELKDFLDPEIYDCMNVPGERTKNVTGYHGYRYIYLESSDGINLDSDVRAVVAYPVVYGKKGINVYYRTTETGTTFQADMKDVQIPTKIIHVKDLDTKFWKFPK